jgi:hypothetical protein
MDPTTITNLTFLVGGVTAPVVSYDPLTRIATLQPASDLAASTTYNATVSNQVMDLSGNAMAASYLWSFTTGTALAPGAVPLNSAAPFGNFSAATAGMTNTGIHTVINGDIGTQATTTGNITGFHNEPASSYTYGVIAPPHNVYDVYTETLLNNGQVNGNIYTCTVSTTGPTSGAINAAACAIANAAALDTLNAYNALSPAQMPGGLAAPGGRNLGGQTLFPGIYISATGFDITGGDLTLDGNGDANAVFVFQMPSSALTIGDLAVPRNVLLQNGAQAKNIFWYVGSAATINPSGGGTVEGTIIAQAGISFSTAGTPPVTTLNGRAMVLTGSVTMVNTIINVPLP